MRVEDSMRMFGVVAMIALAGCPFYSSRRPDPPSAPTTPIAIPGINSQFDDFNSADMSPYWRQQLVFSTNRGSEGKQFDLYETNLSWISGSAQATIPTPFVPALMSERDERGPIVIMRSEWDGTEAQKSGMWFSLTSDRDGGSGGLDLYARECPHFAPHREGPCADATEISALAALNTTADDAYLSRPFAPRSVLFASNRAGSRGMDIYAARWDEGKTLLDSPAAITLVEELSSESDDTAPFVTFPAGAHRNNDVEMVFVSSREGGLGEHDIYCSRLDKGHWTTPKNMGSKINSPRDEYRPIVIEVNTTRFLIFSSTREGGLGGYDLYIVGYPGCSR